MWGFVNIMILIIWIVVYMAVGKWADKNCPEWEFSDKAEITVAFIYTMTNWTINGPPNCEGEWE